jgi:two-component system, sensor histidine kinase and response regulator
MNCKPHGSRRLLVVDDNAAIHDDLRKILLPPTALEDGLDEDEANLFGSPQSAGSTGFDIDSAYQGQEGLELVRRSLEQGRPYSVAFVDVRMPPGWDGIETITHFWEFDPDLQVVICTAYTDYSWLDIVGQLGESHNFVILKKPFDNIEVLQLAHSLTAKRASMEAAAVRMKALDAEVRQRRQTERDLLAALEQAEESNRCKRSFLATMGHELRTPLNAIIGYSEMLDEDARRLELPCFIAGLSKVQMAGKHLLGLINGILDMSRIESGKMSICPQRVSVRQMAQEVMGLMSPLAQSNRNKLELKLEDEDIWMEVDETRFRQSLLNLVGNACKFTSEGTVTLEVNREKADEQEWIEWCVRDTGIGIAEENLGKLFQPFNQVDSNITRKFGGSGLGLAISQKLCEMMGGKITVDSKLGQGSAFTIRMPAVGTSGAVEQDGAMRNWPSPMEVCGEAARESGPSPAGER